MKIDYKTAYENVMMANHLLEKEIERLNNNINKAIKFIKETPEYYHDGVNEEIIDILKGEEIG